MADATKSPKYRLKVTAGADYNPSTHQDVPVNEPQTLRIDNDQATTHLSVRIRNYTGFPDNAPSTNPYFTHSLHQKDQYSISFAISFKSPVNGDDLLFGNDFDRPIRDRLPPGFNAALRLVQWTIDPSLDGDAYADKPYLYSPGIATWNQFRVGEKIDAGGKGDVKLPDVHDLVIEEGGEGDGVAIRERKGVPETVQERRSYFQNEANRKQWEFEMGRVYLADFGNQYLDFNDFTLRLPGFSINALNYIDEKTHSLRYVLKHRATGKVYFVVLFTLVLLQEEGEEDQGTFEEQAGIGTGKASGRFDWEEKPSAADVE
ncbi:hypothetical protein BJX63DRAFT_421189 [Aspergillus granulosus]|uniref:Domain of unknown function at the cortex 1 domain-containing protein n=1 Tax=Aspergillus granulosus TaxID=176169 RepID=A0ABR4HDI9_9EURO